ncbi:MAG: TetR/AcrR family transcriptional regulator [Thermoanaerobaculia bacterium]|nr:TetR/AcrR family transcriptional regulator [Thermoanaerobaculia bacterium]
MVQHRSEGPRQRKQREILLAAARVFRRRGIHSTGMRDIAHELEMAVGNLYYYFRDKQELLAFCQEDSLTRLLSLATHVANLSATAEEKLRLLVVGHLRCLHEEAPGAAAHLEVDAVAGPQRPGLIEQRDLYEAAFRQILTDGIAEAVFRDIDPKLTARTLLGALNWTAKWYDPEGAMSLEAMGNQILDLVLGGLLAEPCPIEDPTTTGRTLPSTHHHDEASL